jgi:hypothetical protein
LFFFFTNETPLLILLTLSVNIRPFDKNIIFKENSFGIKFVNNKYFFF